MTEAIAPKAMEFCEQVIAALQEELAALKKKKSPDDFLGVLTSDFEADLCGMLEPGYEPVDYPGQSPYSLATCGVELNVTDYEAIPLMLPTGELRVDDTNRIEFCAVLESVKWRISEGKTGVYALYTVKEI